MASSVRSMFTSRRISAALQWASERIVASGRSSPLNLDRAFQAAAARGQLKVLRYLHGCGVNVTAEDNAALIAAAGNGRLEAVIFLHQHGADIHAGEDAAVRRAAAQGHLDVVIYLHQQGVDIAARNGEALRLAAAGRHGEVVRYLHRNGAQHSLLSEESRAQIQAMLDELLAAPDIYHPSRFWEFLNSCHNTLLAWGGERNFKRTINQNYFNFIPTSLFDRKTLNVLRLWLRHSSLKPFGYELEDPDCDPALWFSWDESYFIFKGKRRFGRHLYKWFVGSLYEYALKTDGSGVLSRLEEPALGNPIQIRRDGRLVSQDLVNSVRERNVIVESSDRNSGDRLQLIAELGAGYGRLGHVLLATTNCRYVVFDIPPALHVSQWYLSRLFSEKRIFRFRRFRSYAEIAEELAQADIAFFTPNQLEMFPDRCFDAFVTISSLHEMRREQIDHFLRLMAAKTRHVIYIKQHRYYVNRHDQLCIKRADYTLPADFKVIMERSDALNPGFFELVASRRH